MDIRIIDFLGVLSGVCSVFLICGRFWPRFAEDAMICARLLIFSIMFYVLLLHLGLIDILLWNQGTGKLLIAYIAAIIMELLCFRS